MPSFSSTKHFTVFHQIITQRLKSNVNFARKYSDNNHCAITWGNTRTRESSNAPLTVVRWVSHEKQTWRITLRMCTERTLTTRHQRMSARFAEKSSKASECEIYWRWFQNGSESDYKIYKISTQRIFRTGRKELNINSRSKTIVCFCLIKFMNGL